MSAWDARAADPPVPVCCCTSPRPQVRTPETRLVSRDQAAAQTHAGPQAGTQPQPTLPGQPCWRCPQSKAQPQGHAARGSIQHALLQHLLQACLPGLCALAAPLSTWPAAGAAGSLG